MASCSSTPSMEWGKLKEEFPCILAHALQNILALEERFFCHPFDIYSSGSKLTSLQINAPINGLLQVGGEGEPTGINFDFIKLYQAGTAECIFNWGGGGGGLAPGVRVCRGVWGYPPPENFEICNKVL